VNITGPQGPQGNPGTPGTNGTNGSPGIPGTNGTNGVNGTNASVTATDGFIIVTNGVVSWNTTKGNSYYNDTATINTLIGNVNTNVTAVNTSLTTEHNRIDAMNLSKIDKGSDINGTLNMSYLRNGPAGCSPGYALTNISNMSTVVCTQFATQALIDGLNNSKMNATGNINISLYNITADHSTFNCLNISGVIFGPSTC
jgi:hypothetical protein